MRALYRAGRQADALAVYRQTSELLREELGLEPSPMLQELERAILAHDVSLDGDMTASRDVSAGVCPFKGLAFFDRADAKFFCGRERLVSDLLARAVESPLVGIIGSSGIGKSAFFATDKVPMTLDSRATHTTRRYNRLHDIVKDVDWARVLVGFHFRNSDLQGSALGRRVGRYVAGNYFQRVG